MTATGEGIDATLEIADADSLLPHEEVVESQVRLVQSMIARDGVVRVPVIADRTSRVILDGHHRYAALVRLGARRIPVAFVDYKDPKIRIESWRAQETPPTKAEVVARAVAHHLFPPKTTRHPLLNAFREWPVSVAQLR